MEIFELSEIAQILDMDLTRAKNWTNGRTDLVIEPSLRKASGLGTRNVFSLRDLYVFAIAQAFSDAGFAAKAIGKLEPAVRASLDKKPDSDAIWTIWRMERGGDFQVKSGQAKTPKGGLSHTLEIGALLGSVDKAISAFEQQLANRPKKKRKRKAA